MDTRVRTETHPVLRQRGFVAAIPPLHELIERFDDCLRVGELSLSVVGRPRAGKTTARQYLKRTLQDEGSVVVVSLQMGRSQDVKRIDRTDFWHDLLPNKRQIKGHTPAEAKRHLINTFAVEADRSDTERIVIMCDEAQNLTIQHLAMLKELTDALIDGHLSPFILLLSQLQIYKKVEQLKAAELFDLVDRFFTKWHPFRGVYPREIKEVFAEWDTLEYPAGSGITFTAHFAPELFNAGWRLQNEAEAVEGEIRRVFDEFRFGPLIDIEMKFLVATARGLLTKLQLNPRLRPGDLVKTCVDGSGLIDARQMVRDETKPSRKD